MKRVYQISAKILIISLLLTLFTVTVNAEEKSILERFLAKQEIRRAKILPASLKYSQQAYQDEDEFELEFIIYETEDKFRIDYLSKYKNGVNIKEGTESIIYDGSDYYHLYQGLVDKLEQDDLVNSHHNWINHLNKEIIDEEQELKEEYLLTGKIKEDQLKIYLSKDELNLTRVVIITSQGRKEEVKLKEYQTVTKGLKLPKEILHFSEEELLAKTDLIEVELKDELADKYFQPQAEESSFGSIILDFFR